MSKECDEKTSYNFQKEDKQIQKAESKTEDNNNKSSLPPKPPNDEKKHWSVTEEGSLVARATAHVYRAIVASQSQGGMRDYLNEKCGLFLDISGELPLECTAVFQEYEKHIDTSLEEFAISEGKTSPEVMEIIERVSASHKKAAKNLDMLLAATNFDKFSKMMNRRAVESEKKKKEQRDDVDRRTREQHERLTRMPERSSAESSESKYNECDDSLEEK